MLLVLYLYFGTVFFLPYAHVLQYGSDVAYVLYLEAVHYDTSVVDLLLLCT